MADHALSLRIQASLLEELSLPPLGIVGNQVPGSIVKRAKALLANSETVGIKRRLLGRRGPKNRVGKGSRPDGAELRVQQKSAKALPANSETLELPRRLRRLLEIQRPSDGAGKSGRPVDTEPGVLLIVEAPHLPSFELRVIDELDAMHDSSESCSGVPIRLDKPAIIVNHSLIGDCREVVEPGLRKTASETARPEPRRHRAKHTPAWPAGPAPRARRRVTGRSGTSRH